MGYGKRDRDISATYCRSYLVTLGAAFAGGSAFFLSAAPAGNWPGWGIGLLATLLIGGTLLVAIGLFGSERFVRRCAETASGHEAALVVMAMAYPVYLLLRLVYDRRQYRLVCDRRRHAALFHVDGESRQMAFTNGRGQAILKGADAVSARRSQ
ncbi:hypothetical protein BLA17378_04467 [Burkholderia aenigmatica]|uniref:Uncharacterized protein n=1 Tax=Burkholderia aenigmatica TaxID=2015348 RepID=A0ABY6Y011_9BURK|nr:hypothetical protein BLA17378_04467 [Burkholderia aenigmatica]VWC98170.1 hypothetical protein BLA18628_02322 [Burkholderia aenigmatica]